MAKMSATQAAVDNICAGFEALGAAIEALSEASPPASPGGDDEDTPKPRRKKGAAKKAGKKKKGPTIVEVRAALKLVVDEYGKEGAAEVLEPFGQEKVTDLDEDQYAEVITAAGEYLEDE